MLDEKKRRRNDYQRAYRKRPYVAEAARQRAAIWYRDNRERTLAAHKTKRDAIRAELLHAYGGKCECCGEANARFLTIDHINGGGTAHRRLVKNNGGGDALARDLKRLGWPRDWYRLLCFNCNCGRAYNGGVCPHLMTSNSSP